MRSVRKTFLFAALLGLIALKPAPARAQQFNSDNYLSKPHGVATMIWTVGERNAMWMTTLSLIPRWEFTAAAYVFYDDQNPRLSDGYSTSYYFKYMIFENKAKTGGVAFKGGTGLEPGYLDDKTGLEDAFQTYWVNSPVTLPLFGNKVSWDIMPGGNVTKEYGEGNETVGSFTYTTRLAWYPYNPVWALVGEVYGSKGAAETDPQYRVGIRYEPNQYTCLALTYDDQFGSGTGGGIEFGMMLFSPPFAKLGGSKE
jgi:hypothetical protein